VRAGFPLGVIRAFSIEEKVKKTQLTAETDRLGCICMWHSDTVSWSCMPHIGTDVRIFAQTQIHTIVKNKKLKHISFLTLH